MTSNELHEKKMKISAKLFGLCRTCLAAEDESEADLYPIGDIFLEADEITSQVQSFEDVLCLFVDDEVGDQKDRLPKSMCLTCINKARSAFQFIEMCRQTDALLLELLNDQKEEQETKPVISEHAHSEGPIEQKPPTVDSDVVEEISAEASPAHEVLIIEQIPIEEEVDTGERLELEVISFEAKDPPATKQNPKHVCDICQKSFTQTQTLNRHKKIHTRDSNPGKPCDYCDRTFLRSDDLRRHIRTHTNERPYACDLCNRAYKQSFELKEHKKLIHPKSGVRKYISCTICNKQVSTRNGFYVHMKTHRGEKNHECAYCGKKFVTSGELTSHLKHIHTSEVKAEQFPCGVGECPRKFVTKAALRYHRTSKHEANVDTDYL